MGRGSNSTNIWPRPKSTCNRSLRWLVPGGTRSAPPPPNRKSAHHAGFVLLRVLLWDNCVGAEIHRKARPAIWCWGRGKGRRERASWLERTRAGRSGRSRTLRGLRNPQDAVFSSPGVRKCRIPRLGDFSAPWVPRCQGSRALPGLRNPQDGVFSSLSV